MEDPANPPRYEIHVRGLVGDHLLDAFPGLQVRHREHETVLTGGLPDQAALLGVIGRIESLGLELLEVRRVKPRRIPSTQSAGRRPSGDCADTARRPGAAPAAAAREGT
jgi:hypothetical protein